MNKKNILIIIACLFTAVSVQAQRTSGGSTFNWRQYNIRIDTTYKEVTEPANYPTTSNTSIRIGIINGNGLWAQKPQLYFPENGIRGTQGGGMSGGFDFCIGMNSNLTSINDQLHPAIDFSVIGNLGIGVYNYDHQSTDPEFTVDYGSTINFYGGFGPGVSLKPKYIINNEQGGNPGVVIDVAYVFDLVLYGTGETTYRTTDGVLTGYYNHVDDPLGARIDGMFQIGVRYNVIGFHFRSGSTAVQLAAPEFYHEYEVGGSFFSEFIEEDVNFSRREIAISFHF